jgi:hypothetical protein
MNTKRLFILTSILYLGLFVIASLFFYFLFVKTMMQEQVALRAALQKVEQTTLTMQQGSLKSGLAMDATLNDAQRSTRLEALWQEAFTGEESYEEERLCQASGLFTASGKKVFPIHPMYKNLGQLGEVFTALRCGVSAEPRLMELGFSEENYSDGMSLFLKQAPGVALKSVLEKHAFVCVDAGTCLTWRREEPLTKVHFMDLELYYDEIESSACVACQVTPEQE